MRMTVFGAAAAAALAALGCKGDGKASLPSPVEAGGKITLASGEPVKDVRVMFEPIEAAAPASGVVGADGSFTLRTYDEKPGACPGKYRVIFLQVMNSRAEIAKSTAGLAVIPAKYKDEGSPLEVEIPSGGNASLSLQLDAK